MIQSSDFTRAFRVFRDSPGYACAVILSLVLGIGLNTALFGVVASLLLAPLPYSEPERLATLQDYRTVNDSDLLTGSEFEAVRAGSRAFSEVGAYRAGMAQRHALTIQATDGSLAGFEVSPDLFRVLGVRAALGRTFVSDDARSGDQLVVLSDRARRRLFSNTAAVLGSVVSVDGVPHTVAGVMPDGFWFPSPEGAFWTLLADRPGRDPEERSLSLVGRLRPGASTDQVQREAELLVNGLAADRPDQQKLWIRAFPLEEAGQASDARYFYVLQGVAASILLMCCINVAGLGLVRMLGRQRDMAVRAALGASRRQILRPLVGETVVIVGVAALLSVLLSSVLLSQLTAALPQGTAARDLLVGASRAPMFTFGVVASIVSALACALLPAVQAVRVDLISIIKGGASPAHGAGRMRARGVLVILQLAISIVLVVGTGMLVDHIARMNSWRPGFAWERLIRMDLRASSEQTAAGPVRSSPIPGVLRQVQAVSGVESAAVEARFTPPGGTVSGHAVPGESTCRCVEVSSDYFRTLGIPLTRGRAFSSADDASTTVAVVDERLAASLWPGTDPIGQALKLGSAESAAGQVTVVGVARNTEFDRPSAADLMAAPPSVYVLAPFDSARSAALVVLPRKGADPLLALRSAVAMVNPSQPLQTLQRLEVSLRSKLEPLRWYVRLFGLFASLGLTLAVTGLYGVVAYRAALRRKEFAIRLALGSSPRAMAMLVIGEGLRLVVLGVVAGGVGAFVIARVIESLVLGSAPITLPTLAGIILLLALVVVVANAVPVLRAARIHPSTVLREN